ncbi:MAG: two-component regulator propeller domain-containing protein [Bacteroidota bacterium]
MHKLLFVLLFLQLQVIALAQSGKEFDFTKVDEELTENTVTSILQDSRGFLWIGTGYGLNRYDGHHMVNYEFSQDDPGSIGYGGITSIYEDSKGVLWIGTTEDGLNRYHYETDSFSKYSHDYRDHSTISNNYVTTILEDYTGSLWIGTAGGGLNMMDPDRVVITRYFKNTDDPFGLSGNVVTGIEEDENGNIWVGTEDNGMSLFIRNDNRFIHYKHDPKDELSLNSNTVYTMHKSRDGSIWIGTENGLNKLVYKKAGRYIFENIPYDNILDDKVYNVVLSVMVDDKNRLWIGTENGGLIVKDLKTNQERKYTKDPAGKMLSGNSIWSIYEDNQGFVWLGLFNSGLMKVNPNGKRFRHLKSNQLLPNTISNDMVTSFAQIDEDNFWVGTDGGGLYQWNRTNDAFYKFTDFKDDGVRKEILSMLMDSRGDLWVGFWKGGIRVLKKGSKHFEKINYPDESEFEDGGIFYMTEDHQGNMWISVHKQGLYKYNPSDQILEKFLFDPLQNDGLSTSELNVIFEDSKHNIWIGTSTVGVNIMEKNQFGHKLVKYGRTSEPGAISGSKVNCIFEDSDNNVWVGTESKLNLFDRVTKSFKSFGVAEGMPNESVRGILEDDQKNLWISTRKGITKLDKSNFKFSNYTTFDGLQSNEFIRNACLNTSDGQMLFGGINGFNAFNPEEIECNNYQPMVYFTDFKLSNIPLNPQPDSPLMEDISLAKEINLEHNQNDFSIEFSIISFSQSRRNVFAYQLENYDEDWRMVGNQRSANYTHIPPGDYIFKVKATNNDGVWSDNIASVNIHIERAWYHSYLAYAIYILVIGALVWLGIYLLLNRERLKVQYDLEHMELSKMQELDEMKSRFFANISHEFRSPLTLILGPLRGLMNSTEDKAQKEQYGLMFRNAQSLLSLINQLLDLSKLERGKMKLEASEQDIVEFLKPLVKSYTALANKKYIRYKIDLPSQQLPVYFDRDKLEKIINNLLSNAFKYTPDFGTVELKLTDENNSILLQVSDSGIGIPDDEAEYIFNRYYRVNNKQTTRNEGTGIGLSLARELAQLHKGSIVLVKGQEQGATFNLWLPKGHTHLTEEQIITRQNNRLNEEEQMWEDFPASTDELDETIERIENEANNLPLILVVEDDKDTSRYVRKTLEEDYRVIEAHDGEEGIKSALNQIPDLIISDVMMPGVDGFELCGTLKNDLKTSHIPIILLTAKASDKSAIEGFELGADYYINKPFDPKVLLLRVKNILNTRDKIVKQLGSKSLHMEPKDIQMAKKDQDFLNRAVEIVEAHMSDSGFNVEDLGRELGLSRMQLYRKLKALIGKSANEFIRFIKLKRAAQLLNHGSMTISEITYKVGFNDLKYFRDCFKKQYGVNPSDYLNKNTNISKE